MKRILAILLAFILVLTLSACHKHSWEPATCDKPKTCSVCGKTSGDPLGHSWGEPEYEWSEDLSSVTASRFCQNDHSHVESETVVPVVEETKAATCTEPGESVFTAAFENTIFEPQVRVEALPEALGHAWGEPEYEWSEDLSSITATRVCANDPSHVETEIADVTAELTKPASCEEPGETCYSAVFGNEAFAPQSRTEADIEPLGHAWGEIRYEWAEDLSSVTATRVCANDPSHIETETAAVTREVTKPASCEEPGETCYSAVFENEAFGAQSRTETDIEALGHSWGEITYEWSDDLSSVTATRVCANDPSHVETETAAVTAEVLSDASCDEPGETVFTAVFANEALEAQSRTETSADAEGHVWCEPTYEWAEDLSSVTATRVCERDAAHVETETVQTSASTITNPSCSAAGETSYAAHFENPTFADQIRVEADIEALGHAWGEPTYEWAEDLSSITATRVCANDPSHVETETAAVTAEITKPAVCEEAGQTTYTAVFENEAFEAQSRTETDIEALGHAWGEPSYEWAEDLSSITATRVCANDPAHVETETAAVTAEITKPAVCEEMGDTTYSAVFENEAFEAQSRTETDIEALGHAWGEPSYEWAEDLSSITATRVCANDPSHAESETVAVTSEVTKPATCTEMGDTTYSAVFENEAFAPQSRTETDIEALGHSWMKATHRAPQTCSVCGETEGDPLPIHFFDMSFKEFRQLFNKTYAGSMNLTTSRKGFELHMNRDNMVTSGFDNAVRVYHADEFKPGSHSSLKMLKRFNLLEISYVSDSPRFDTSISARVAQLGYRAAKILDPTLGQTAFFKDGLDLFDAKGNEQSFTHNGFVYTLSCSRDGGSYRYVFTMTLEENLD